MLISAQQKDHDLWIRLSRVANLTYVKQLGSLYRINPKSITNTAKAPHPNLGAVYGKH